MPDCRASALARLALPPARRPRRPAPLEAPCPRSHRRLAITPCASASTASSPAAVPSARNQMAARPSIRCASREAAPPAAAALLVGSRAGAPGLRSVRCPMTNPNQPRGKRLISLQAPPPPTYSLAEHSITVPFPLSMDALDRLLFRAALERTGSGRRAAQFLGRSPPGARSAVSSWTSPAAAGDPCRATASRPAIRPSCPIAP
jgi:hypothetical protein